MSESADQWCWLAALQNFKVREFASQLTWRIIIIYAGSGAGNCLVSLMFVVGYPVLCGRKPNTPWIWYTSVSWAISSYCWVTLFVWVIQKDVAALPSCVFSSFSSVNLSDPIEHEYEEFSTVPSASGWCWLLESRRSKCQSVDADFVAKKLYVVGKLSLVVILRNRLCTVLLWLIWWSGYTCPSSMRNVTSRITLE